MIDDCECRIDSFVIRPVVGSACEVFAMVVSVVIASIVIYGCDCVEGRDHASEGDDVMDADDGVSGEDCIDDTPGDVKVWLDESTGLMWQTDPSCDAYIDSADICHAMKLAGYNDWRMPTISELRTLIRGCPKTQTGGVCDVTDDCTDPVECRYGSDCFCNAGDGPEGGCYGPTEISDNCMDYWSSSETSNYLRWMVSFYVGGVGVGAYDGYARIICVRDDT